MTSAVRRVLAPWHDDAAAANQEARIAKSTQRRFIVIAEANIIAARAETIAQMVAPKVPASA